MPESTNNAGLETERKTAGPQSKNYDSVFLKACRREPTDYTPVWLMRQAGRYQKEFRQIREKVGLLELCKRPDLACEVTVRAVEQLNADAGIIFADILLPIDAWGCGLEYVKGEGPIIRRPVRTYDDFKKLERIQAKDALSYVLKAIELTCAELKPGVPLLGFAGAPFTLASYLIEGGASRNFEFTKIMMHEHKETWHELMEFIVDFSIDYLNAQAEAGAEALQIFDSWVGCLSPADYCDYVQPHSKRLIAGLKKGTPVIHFGTGTTSLLELMTEAGGDVIGVDWRIKLSDAWKRIGYDRAIQGNLDPVLLLGSQSTIEEKAGKILAEANGRPGHIFNLGHGVLPPTDIENARRLVNFVHEFSHVQRQ